MSGYRKFAGDTLIYGLSTIIGRLINFALAPIYARVLSVGNNGIFTALYGYASIVNAMLAFGMETTFFRYLQKRSDQKQLVYNNAFGAVIATSVVFLTFSILFLDPIVRFLQAGELQEQSDYSFYVKCFLVVLVADAFCVLPFAKLRAEGRAMRFATVKCLNIFLVVGLNIFFLFVIPWMIDSGMPGAVWMQHWFRPQWVGYVILSNAIASLFTILLLLPEILKLQLRFDLTMFREMLVYSWPVLVANISYIVNESIDKGMLKQLLPADISDEQVGIYGLCAKIALFLNISVQAFRLGAEPFFFSHAKNKNARETYARIMNYFVIAVALICVGLVANVNLLATIIVGPEEIMKQGQLVHNVYWTGLAAVPPLVFGYLSLGIYMNLSVWYKLSDQTRYGLYISGIGAVLTIVLNWIYIPQYSYMASAWVSLTAYATMMLLSYWWGQKNYPIPYQVKKNLAYIIASVILVYLSFKVFHRNIFAGNILLLGFVLVTYYAERKELTLLLKSK